MNKDIYYRMFYSKNRMKIFQIFFYMGQIRINYGTQWSTALNMDVISLYITMELFQRRIVELKKRKVEKRMYCALSVRNGEIENKFIW